MAAGWRNEDHRPKEEHLQVVPRGIRCGRACRERVHAVPSNRIGTGKATLVLAKKQDSISRYSG